MSAAARRERGLEQAGAQSRVPVRLALMGPWFSIEEWRSVREVFELPLHCLPKRSKSAHSRESWCGHSHKCRGSLAALQHAIAVFSPRCLGCRELADEDVDWDLAIAAADPC